MDLEMEMNIDKLEIYGDRRQWKWVAAVMAAFLETKVKIEQAKWCAKIALTDIRITVRKITLEARSIDISTI